MHVRELDIVLVMERYVKVSIQNVIAQPIMYGVVALAYVIVVSNTAVVERDILAEVVHLVEENIRVVIVPHIIVGMVVPVLMFIVMYVRVDIQPRVRE